MINPIKLKEWHQFSQNICNPSIKLDQLLLSTNIDLNHYKKQDQTLLMGNLERTNEILNSMLEKNYTITLWLIY